MEGFKQAYIDEVTWTCNQVQADERRAWRVRLDGVGGLERQDTWTFLFFLGFGLGTGFALLSVPDSQCPTLCSCPKHPIASHKHIHCSFHATHRRTWRGRVGRERFADLRVWGIRLFPMKWDEIWISWGFGFANHVMITIQ